MMELKHPLAENDPVLQLSLIPALHYLPVVLCKFQLRDLGLNHYPGLMALGFDRLGRQPKISKYEVE